MKSETAEIVRGYLDKVWDGKPRPHKWHGAPPEPCLGPIILEGHPAMLVPLTRCQWAVIDIEDHEEISQFNWCVLSCRKRWLYAGRAIRWYGNKLILGMHRQIMKAPEGFEIDHIDGDGFDNRRRNLRICTHQQNIRNQKRSIVNTSGYKGVTWSAKRNRWIAAIKDRSKLLVIGNYPDKREAALAYNQAALKLYGDYARLNEILPAFAEVI